MRYIRRQLETQVLQAVKGFPAVVLTGPRRAGKTLLLRRLFPKASYFLAVAAVTFASSPSAPLLLTDIRTRMSGGSTFLP